MNELFLEGNEYLIYRDEKPFAMGKFDGKSVNSGDVFVGRVCEMRKDLSASFVNIGDKRTAFLQNLTVKTGDYVLCQVETSSHDTKGADVTCDISFTGKFAVVTFSKDGKAKFEFSKKIEEFNRDLIKVPKAPNYETQIKVRTAFCGDFEALQAEIDGFCSEFRAMLSQSHDDVKPVKKVDLYEYLNRRYHKFEFDKIHKEHHLNFYQEYNRASDYKKRKIYLKSGGFISVDKTEAMYVIDVNSGSSNKSALDVNIEATEAIISALRIQNICGIIIVDFINMNKDDEQNLLDYFKKSSRDDYTFMKVLGFTKLGLLEIERKRN